jgi:hypothetical protein
MKEDLAKKEMRVTSQLLDDSFALNGTLTKLFVT